MEKNEEENQKGFFVKLFEKLDKKLEAKSKQSGCCCGPKKDGKDSDRDSCCS